MFLPILNSGDTDDQFSEILVNVFEYIGIDYTLSATLVAMVLFYTARSMFMVTQNIYVVKLMTNLLVKLKQELMSKIFRAQYSYFIRKESGYFINAATIEYNRISSACEKCMQLVVSSGFAIVYFALPMVINPVLTSVILLVGVPGILILKKANKLTAQYSIASTSINSRLQSYLMQVFRNYKYLKATHSSKNILAKILGTIQQQGKILFKQYVLGAFISNAVELVSLMLVVGMLYYYVEVKALELIEVLFLLFILRRAVGYALAVYLDYRKFLGSAGSIKVFLNLERELESERENINLGGQLPDFTEPLRFESVSFGYDGATEILTSVDIVIPPRKTVALVGSSGSGKTTLVTLLTGIINPTEGCLYMGNLPYQDINQVELRSKIGYVTQESVIFNDTIQNNVTLWQDEVNPKDLESVSAQAYIDQFVDKLPEKFETHLGDEGMNMSGGQRQRISIARELYKQAELLVFDEATSALDTKSEKQIQRNLDRMKGYKTIIVIAHRLSTVKNSDVVYVLKDGEVIERGSYSELMSLAGEFKSMVDQQTLSDD